MATWVTGRGHVVEECSIVWRFLLCTEREQPLASLVHLLRGLDIVSREPHRPSGCYVVTSRPDQKVVLCTDCTFILRQGQCSDWTLPRAHPLHGLRKELPGETFHKGVERDKNNFDSISDKILGYGNWLDLVPYTLGL